MARHDQEVAERAALEQGIRSRAARDAARALAAGGSGTVNDGDARVVLGVVDRAMAAHAGFER